MFETLLNIDWCATLTLVYWLSVLAMVVTVMVMVLRVQIREEDLRDHDADIEQAINIANSH